MHLAWLKQHSLFILVTFLRLGQAGAILVGGKEKKSKYNRVPENKTVLWTTFCNYNCFSSV